MDRQGLINEYVDYSNQTNKAYDTSVSYYEGLKYRLTGCTSISEIKEELNKFLDNNQIEGEVRKDLTKIANDFDETTDLYTAQRYLENYLGELVDKNKKELNKSQDDINEIRKEIIDDAKKDLEKVGVKLVGDEEKVFDDINDLKDVEKIKDNVDEVKDYLEKEYKDKDSETIEVEVDTISDALDRSGDQTLLNETLDNQVETDSNSPVQDRSDGSIEIEGNANNTESMNFMAMMASVLVTSVVGNDLSMNLNLDMRMMKDVTDISKFKAIFGNFPLSKMTDDKRLSPEIIAEIQERAKDYNPSKDYLNDLNKTSPEVAQAFELINNNLLNKEGAFQFLLKNGGTEHEMMFALDEHYNNVSEAFGNNGAMLTNDVDENSIVRLPNTTKGDQLLILKQTNAELKQNSLENTNQQVLEQGVAMVKKYEPPKPEENLDEAANVSPTLLIIVTIVELLLIGAYIFMMMNR